MKKYLLALMFVFATLICANAEEKKVRINLLVRGSNMEGNQHPRSPLHTPEVYIDDYTLIFDTSFEGLSVELLQDDEVVYSDIIDENGEVVLPDYLVGEYELRFYVGDFIFVGEIEL